MAKKAPLLSSLRMKAGELRAVWAREAYDRGDVCYVWGEGIKKCDSHLLHNWLNLGHFDPVERKLGKSFQDELIARGYDLSTLRFSISKKNPPKSLPETAPATTTSATGPE